MGGGGLLCEILYWIQHLHAQPGTAFSHSESMCHMAFYQRAVNIIFSHLLTGKKSNYSSIVTYAGDRTKCMHFLKFIQMEINYFWKWYSLVWFILEHFFPSVSLSSENIDLATLRISRIFNNWSPKATWLSRYSQSLRWLIVLVNLHWWLFEKIKQNFFKLLNLRLRNINKSGHHFENWKPSLL